MSALLPPPRQRKAALKDPLPRLTSPLSDAASVVHALCPIHPCIARDVLPRPSIPHDALIPAIARFLGPRQTHCKRKHVDGRADVAYAFLPYDFGVRRHAATASVRLRCLAYRNYSARAFQEKARWVLCALLAKGSKGTRANGSHPSYAATTTPQVTPYMDHLMYIDGKSIGFLLARDSI